MLLSPSIARLKLYLKQDVDFASDTFTLFDSAGSLLNLSGATVSMITRATRDTSGAALLTFTSGAGITLITTPASVSFSYTAAQVASLAPGSYFADLKMTMGDGTHWDPLSVNISVEATT